MQEQHFYMVWNMVNLDTDNSQTDFMEVDNVTYRMAIGKQYRYADYYIYLLAKTEEVNEAIMQRDLLRVAQDWHMRDYMAARWGVEVTALSLTSHGVYRGKRQLISRTDLHIEVDKKMRLARKAIGK